MNLKTTRADAAPRRSLVAQLASFMNSHAGRCLILALLGFIVRTPALQGAPIWDDHWLINDNPMLRSPLLFGETFRHYLFLDGLSSHYRPVQNISYGIDYLFWNTDPYGYHLTNVLLHISGGVLLYGLLRKLLAQFFAQANGEAPQSSHRVSSLVAFFVALLWVVHPVHSAAVDYISGRADSLSFVFAASAWLLVLRGRTRNAGAARVYYVAAAVCGMLALCSREIAFVWFCLFILHTFVFEKATSRRAKLVAAGCCLLLMGSYAGLRQLPSRPERPAATGGDPAAVRAVLMLRALGDYARLMICPTKLCMERTLYNQQNYRSSASWRNSASTEYLSILGVGLLAALAYGASRKGSWQNVRVFGALWFLLAYLPISNLVELNANVAEHWLYLPSVGFLLFAAGIVLELGARARVMSIALASLAVCALGTRAYVRSTDWVTPKTFFERTIAAGGSSSRAAVNLALIYAHEGQDAKAEAIFRRVLEIAPDYAVARNGLAAVLCRQGKRSEGEATYVANQASISQAPKEANTWFAVLGLARLRHEQDDDAGAIEVLQRGRRLYPHIWELVRAESELLRQINRPDAALRLVAQFAEANWWHHGSSLAIGRLLAEKGEADAAVEALQFASWLDVHDAESLNLVALIRVRQERLEDARAAQKRAVARRPDEPRQYRLLADILQKMGRSAEAERAAAKVATLTALADPQVRVN